MRTIGQAELGQFRRTPAEGEEFEEENAEDAQQGKSERPRLLGGGILELKARSGASEGNAHVYEPCRAQTRVAQLLGSGGQQVDERRRNNDT